VHALAEKAAAHKKQDSQPDPTEKTAAAVSKHVFDHSLTRQEKKTAGPLVHYAFGTAMGAMYGVAVETMPAAQTGFGSVFGVAVWLGAHVLAVPALGLSEPVTKSALSKEAGEFGAHLVYGTASEGVRRAIRSFVLR
jgi:putative membrane protein